MKSFFCIALLFINVFSYAEDSTITTPDSAVSEPLVNETAKIDTSIAKPSDEQETLSKNFITELRPAVSLPMPKWIQMAVIFGIILLIIYLLRYIIIRRRKKAAPPIIPINPYAQALRSLEKALQLVQRPDQRPFAFAITDAVRQYLSSVYQLPAPECTTEEVFEKLPNVQILTDDIKESIKKFLSQCDLAKFTQQHFDNDTRLKLYQQAKDVIQSADKLLQIQTEIDRSSKEK